jgi:thioesterase domain-containing protein
VPLQPRGSRPPAFAFGGHNGDVFCFRALARHLGEDQPFFGLEPPGLDGQSEPLTRVEDLAACFAQQIRAFHPEGPYIIIGFCAGGTIAFELARQLHRDGATLRMVALFGAPYPTAYRRLPRLRKRLEGQAVRMCKHIRTLASLSSTNWRTYIAEKLRTRKSAPGTTKTSSPDPVLIHRARVERATFTALRNYSPERYDGMLNLFLPCEEWARSREQPLRWRSVAQRTREYFGPQGCSTDIMLLEPHAPVFARLFRSCGETLDRGSDDDVPVRWGGFACEPV